MLILLCTLTPFVGAFCQQPEGEMPIKINEELRYQPLNTQTYLITHAFPWAGNSLLVRVGNDNVVLIDTPYDGVATQALLDWIDAKFGKVKISAIVTGFHQDNLGGNEVLIARDIPVYGMKLTADLVNTQSIELIELMIESVESHENPIYKKRYQQLQLVAPSEIFDLEIGANKIIDIAGEEFDFYFPGESHTIDNTVVFIPSQKLLFGGCMIRALQDQRPGYIGYANMKEWPLSANRVLQKFPDAEMVVPGHGEPGDKSLIGHTVEVLNRWNKEHPEGIID